tara:strand:- start:3552 stop:4232 length:681 start_codon:yes stop_codon:yes gene_type:complete
MPFNPINLAKRSLRKKKELRFFKNASNKEIFTRIYETNKWGDAATRSGKGSNLDRTVELRRQLPAALGELGLKTLLDIPCGDYFWMNETELQIEHYYGADIVASLIQANSANYADATTTFLHLDLLQDSLPHVEAILCRECLVHFSYSDALLAIDKLKSSRASYLMATHFPELANNSDSVTGKHRPLNMCLPPFNWPAPLREITEGDAGLRRGRKCLSIWAVGTLP